MIDSPYKTALHSLNVLRDYISATVENGPDGIERDWALDQIEKAIVVVDRLRVFDRED